MARLTRQQLKKDELADTVAVIQEFFLQHQTAITRISIAVVVVGAIVLGGYFYIRSRQSRAYQDFQQALTTFHAPVSTVSTSNTTPLHLGTADRKYRQALKQFTNIANRDSWLSQGKFARYYQGLCERELGNLPQAEKDLKAVAGFSNHDLAALGKLALASVYAQAGENDQAEKLYRDLENHPTSTVPKATAQLSLAALYQKTKPTEADALYQQIQKDYPGTTAGDVASKMLGQEQ